jgi:hypothetical protein
MTLKSSLLMPQVGEVWLSIDQQTQLSASMHANRFFKRFKITEDDYVVARSGRFTAGCGGGRYTTAPARKLRLDAGGSQ